MIKHVTTSNSGAFSDSFTPDLAGLWSVKARWSGDDEHFGCESQPVSLSVEAVPEKTSPWEKILSILSIIIIIIIIVMIIYLIFRRKRRSKGEKTIQTSSQLKHCIHCGAMLPEESDYCPKCGKKIS
jgi:ribosomal protein L40E